MIENTIISHLITNKEYTKRVLPYIKEEYFSDDTEKTVFKLVSSYIGKYNSVPTREALLIDLDNVNGMFEGLYNSSHEYIKGINPEDTDLNWLVDRTEEFCKERALINSIRQALEIIDGDSKGNLDRGSLPKLMADALAVSFNNSIGHDYIEDAEKRYDSYQRVEDRIPFDIDLLNTITKGGLPRKTINILLAGTGVGKSMFMCHMAAANLKAGKNVLYITLEMSEERIPERIDANLMNISLDDLMHLPKAEYLKKIDRIKEKTVGKIIVKEYPTATANVNHFRVLLNDLKLKKGFVPDIIYIDYINIATSAVLKRGSANSYEYVKSITEEFRGLAVEYNVPIVTATQTNRSGYSDMDIGLEATSESFGLPMTADFMIAISKSEELEKLGQVQIKQLKNRYGDENTWRRFVIGIDRSKMKLFNVDINGQTLNDNGNPNTSNTMVKLAMSTANTGVSSVGGEDDDDDIAIFSKSKFGQADSSGSRLKNKLRRIA